MNEIIKAEIKKLTKKMNATTEMESHNYYRGKIAGLKLASRFEPLVRRFCPICKTEPKFRKVETIVGDYHWAFQCECHSQIRSEKEDAKNKYWLWHPSKNA